MKVSDGRQEVTQILLMVESLVWLMQPRQFEHKKKVFYELLKRGKNDSEEFFLLLFLSFWIGDTAAHSAVMWSEFHWEETSRFN